jgi:hypothetical protein
VASGFSNHISKTGTPAAGRVFWAYGPDKGDITILAVEPHPEGKKHGAYERVKLASMARKKA